MALGDAGVDAGPVVRPITGERGHGPLDLTEQEIDPGAVIGVVAGQRRGHDPARVGVHAEVELSPRPTRARAVPLDQPLARPAQLQAGAVDQQVHGLGLAPTLRAPPPPRPPPARGGRGTSSVAARRLEVVWSGTRRARPSRPTTEPSRPSAWR